MGCILGIELRKRTRRRPGWTDRLGRPDMATPWHGGGFSSVHHFLPPWSVLAGQVSRLTSRANLKVRKNGVTSVPEASAAVCLRSRGAAAGGIGTGAGDGTTCAGYWRLMVATKESSTWSGKALGVGDDDADEPLGGGGAGAGVTSC